PCTGWGMQGILPGPRRSTRCMPAMPVVPPHQEPCMQSTAALATVLSTLLCAAQGALGGPGLDPPAVVSPRCTDQPLVLDQGVDYVLDRIDIRGVYDAAALTLSGEIKTVNITRSRFGQVLAGSGGQAAAMLAQGSAIGSFV